MPAEYAYQPIWIFTVGAILFGSPVPAATQIAETSFSSSVEYCRRYPAVRLPEPRSSIHLSEDKTVLCLDGGLLPSQGIALIRDLKDDGLFVIRSEGGIASLALEIANLLESKTATVVIYDYCLSACAGFIYIASAKTYIVKNSVVAWHYPIWYPAPCEGTITDTLRAEKLESWQKLTNEEKEASCSLSALHAEFFKKRGAPPDILFRTQSQHVKKMIQSANSIVDHNKELFWMWHTRYYQQFFTTKFIYEHYLESQDEVDEIARRFGLPKIIYDP